MSKSELYAAEFEEISHAKAQRREGKIKLYTTMSESEAMQGLPLGFAAYLHNARGGKPQQQIIYLGTSANSLSWRLRAFA
jgi:hypothetical protein